MNKCKRMTVNVIGINAIGETAHARNGNKGECTAIPGQCGCTHAEINLLKVMSDPQFVTITHSPCLDCAKALVDAGVSIVMFLIPYRLDDGVKHLKENGVEIIRYALPTSSPYIQ